MKNRASKIKRKTNLDRDSLQQQRSQHTIRVQVTTHQLFLAFVEEDPDALHVFGWVIERCGVRRVSQLCDVVVLLDLLVEDGERLGVPADPLRCKREAKWKRKN
jgi:hypothetical protein